MQWAREVLNRTGQLPVIEDIEIEIDPTGRFDYEFIIRADHGEVHRIGLHLVPPDGQAPH